jgi:hypothetical protein
MNLLEIRTEVTKKSGRYDLADPSTFADNGMDFHIKAGQLYLDKLVTIPDSLANIFFAPVAGEYSITIDKSCRAIYEVWANDDENRWQLNKQYLATFKYMYDQPVSSITAGAPCDYTLMDMRSISPDAQSSLAEFLSKTAVEGSSFGYRGIVFGPQFDATYVIEVIGLFGQILLTSDLDSNFWSFNYPHLLIMAALRSIETFNRNTEGVNDWSKSIISETNELDLDVAEEESYGVDQMEG